MSGFSWNDLPEGSTLHACGPDGVAVFARFWSEANYPELAPVVTADDQGDDVYFVLSGRARAANYAASGREVQFSDLTAGEAFGIFAAIDGLPRSTNVTALTELRLARLSAERFNRVLDENPKVMRAFLGYLVARVRALSERMSQVTTLSARQRLAAELLAMSHAERSETDTAAIAPVPTQAELAIRICSQRETVGRELSRLKQEGLVDREGRRLRLHSLRGLQTVIDG